MKPISLAAVAVALIVGDVGVLCCGVAVHLSLVSRTLPYMPERVNQQVGYSQTGAFFPDAFYSCMGLSDAAEDSHWPPFLKIAVEYWWEKYNNGHHGRQYKVSDLIKSPFRAIQSVLKKEDRSSGDQLKAFIYGILTHQVSDVSWHSLGVKQGLLIMLAQMEFDGDADKAHSVLDTGGDMILLKQLLNSGQDLGWFNKGKLAWNYPTEDIIEIYKRAGYPISSSSLDYCMIRGKAALETEFRIAKPGFIGFANQSPLLLESLEDYYLGGMLEMTMAVRHCIDGLDRWFQLGPDEDPWDICQVFDQKRPSIEQETFTVWLSNDEENVTIEQVPVGERIRYEPCDQVASASRDDGPTILTTGMAQGLFGKSITFGSFLDGIPSIAFSAPFESADDGSPKGSVYIMALSELVDEGQSSQGGRRRMTQIRPESTVYEYNERYGDKLATIKIAGEDILVVSRPGISKLDFYYQGVPVAHINFDHVQTVYGELGRKLVGEELLVADVDGDGVQDLVIGSPRSDVDGISQEGEVFIIYGNSFAEFLKRSIAGGAKNAMHMEDHLRVNVIHLPAHDRDPNSGYSLFGKRLSMAGSTLLIGSPGRGKVYGFSQGANNKLAFELQPDTGINSYTGFGGDIVASAGDWIVVSNSHENVEYSSMKQCMQCGVIYMFRVSEDGKPYRHAKLSPPDGRSFDRFGQNGAVIGNSTLYVTSSFANNDRGVIWRVDLSRNIDDATTTADQIISQGPPPYSSGFGSAINGIQLPNHQTILAIGMPYYGSTYSSLLQGAVAVYLF